MRRVAVVFAGPVMTVAGINHFVMPQAYASIVPDSLPAPMGLVYLSGLAEIVGGLGTMHPRTRRAAGWLLIVTLVAVFPGNIYMASNAHDYPGVPGGQVSLIARLPFQALFIYWVWLATLSQDDRVELRSSTRSSSPSRFNRGHLSFTQRCLSEGGTVIKDEQWPVARLIPISSASGIEAQERRVASALMAVIAAVPEFGKALLKPLGAPVGRTETFIEVPFKTNGKTLRPDGLILVTRGTKTWSALVETKVGRTSLQTDQMNLYLDLARDLSIDAVLSISNHFVTSSTEYPIEVDRRKLRKVALHHWSWIDVLTEAVVQREHRGVSDPDQAYILRELIRYLSDPRSGAVALDSMGPAWTKIREGARNHTLRKTDENVGAIAGRWDELVRYIALELTKDLGRDVKQILQKAERNPTARMNALRESLASSGKLYAELQIPDAVGSLQLVADLRTRQVTVLTRVSAPRTGRSKGRVSWLLRQLNDAPEMLRIESRIARSQTSLASTLQTLRESPEMLYPDAQKEIREFELSLTRNLGVKRDASKGSFIESVMSATKDFYGDVLQNLRAWKAAPPRLKRLDERQEEEELVKSVPQKLKGAIEQAEAENEETVQSRPEEPKREASAPESEGDGFH